MKTAFAACLLALLTVAPYVAMGPDRSDDYEPAPPPPPERLAAQAWGIQTLHVARPARPKKRRGFDRREFERLKALPRGRREPALRAFLARNGVREEARRRRKPRASAQVAAPPAQDLAQAVHP